MRDAPQQIVLLLSQSFGGFGGTPPTNEAICWGEFPYLKL